MIRQQRLILSPTDSGPAVDMSGGRGAISAHFDVEDIEGSMQWQVRGLHTPKYGRRAHKNVADLARRWWHHDWWPRRFDRSVPINFRASASLHKIPRIFLVSAGGIFFWLHVLGFMGCSLKMAGHLFHGTCVSRTKKFVVYSSHFIFYTLNLYTLWVNTFPQPLVHLDPWMKSVRRDRNWKFN